MQAALIQALFQETKAERIRIAQALLADSGITSLLPATAARVPPSSLPQAESEALAAVGLRPNETTRTRALRARVRHALTFLDLFENSDTPKDLARKLGMSAGRVRQRIRDRTLLSIELNGEKRVPRFQFEGNHEVPGIAKIVREISGKMNPLAFAMWFTTPTADIGDGEDGEATSPRDWLLRTGDVDSVLDLANAL